MKTSKSRKGLITLFFAFGSLFFTSAMPGLFAVPKDSNQQGSILEIEEEVPELALYMGTLQTYTHKLSLSIDAKNEILAAFYAHEAGALLEDIQEEIPLYEGIPVALYIDRMGKEPIEQLKEALKEEKPDYEKINHAMDSVVNACNQCHVSSQFSHIRIKRNPFNPYMQDFSKP